MSNIEQEAKPKKTKNEYIELMKNVYLEISVLSEDLKTLKEEAKDASYDSALLARVAKALAESKVEDILQKQEEFASTVDNYDNSTHEQSDPNITLTTS